MESTEEVIATQTSPEVTNDAHEARETAGKAAKFIVTDNI